MQGLIKGINNMRIKFKQDVGENKEGSETNVKDWIAEIMIRDGQAIELDSHNSIAKSIDDAPNKMIKRGDTRRKSKVE